MFQQRKKGEREEKKKKKKKKTSIRERRCSCYLVSTHTHYHTSQPQFLLHLSDLYLSLMSSGKMAWALLWISTMAVFTVSVSATVHKVGDSAGWTTLIPVDYAKWASSKQIHVGDSLRKLPFPFSSPNFFNFTVYMYNLVFVLRNLSTGGTLGGYFVLL